MNLHLERTAAVSRNIVLQHKTFRRDNVRDGLKSRQKERLRSQGVIISMELFCPIVALHAPFYSNERTTVR